MVPSLIFVDRLSPDAHQALATPSPSIPELSLPFERRQIGRQRVTLSNGQEAGLKLPRGMVLREGDILYTEEQAYVTVRAANELVSYVRCSSAQELARAAYHLGNRHTWVQVGSDWLSYLHDHVLDEMLASHGLDVVTRQLPFEPEAGAYSSTSRHSHGASHSHSH